MATVTNTITLPDGSAPSYCAVEIELVASTTGYAAGWVTATDATIEAKIRPTVTAGVWTTTLTPNADITPSGTVYKVTEYADRARYIHYIEVDADGGTLFDLLADAPASLGSSALSAHIAATPDAHDASAISFAAGTVVTATNAQAAIEQVSVQDSKIWISAHSLFTQQGSPTQTSALAGGVTGWLLDASSTEAVTAAIVLPSWWSTYNVTLYWANASTGSGNVRWLLVRAAHAAGDVVSSGESSQGATAAASTTQWALTTTTVATSLAAEPTKMTRFRVVRDGSNAADTLANDAVLWGVLLERAS